MKRTPAEITAADLPRDVRKWTEGAAIWNSSCSDAARVYLLEKDGGYFLKSAPAGTLKDEAEMTAFFHGKGLSAEVLYYGTEGERDWMVSTRIPGEDCTLPAYLAEPERLCDTAAELLRQLHDMDPAGCPVTDRLEKYTAALRRGIGKRNYEPDYDVGIWQFGSFEEAWAAAEEGVRYLEKDAVIHGDYCLPNILLEDWRFTGFIDLGAAGLFDRHFDIFWGIWSLARNLHTKQWTGRFMDAYGRDRIEPEKLRQIAAMEMIPD